MSQILIFITSLFLCLFFVSTPVVAKQHLWVELNLRLLSVAALKKLKEIEDQGVRPVFLSPEAIMLLYQIEDFVSESGLEEIRIYMTSDTWRAGWQDTSFRCTVGLVGNKAKLRMGFIDSNSVIGAAFQYLWQPCPSESVNCYKLTELCLNKILQEDGPEAVRWARRQRVFLTESNNALIFDGLDKTGSAAKSDLPSGQNALSNGASQLIFPARHDRIFSIEMSLPGDVKSSFKQALQRETVDAVARGDESGFLEIMEAAKIMPLIDAVLPLFEGIDTIYLGYKLDADGKHVIDFGQQRSSSLGALATWRKLNNKKYRPEGIIEPLYSVVANRSLCDTRHKLLGSRVLTQIKIDRLLSVFGVLLMEFEQYAAKHMPWLSDMVETQ